MMLLTSCEKDDKKEENKPTATVEVTEAAKETAKETATIEPTASIQPTESPQTTEATQNPETETTENPQATEVSTATTIPTVQPTVTVKPTKSPTIIVQPTEKPTSTSKPTVAPTNKPTATVAPTTAPTTEPTATAKPTPTLDPNVDSYEWGKHGFESLLPIPLPFSDEEADWYSKKDSEMTYYVENGKRIKFGNAADFIKTFEEYVKSFETYGYTVTCQNAYFTARLGREQLFVFNCINGHVIITITLVS